MFFCCFGINLSIDFISEFDIFLSEPKYGCGGNHTSFFESFMVSI